MSEETTSTLEISNRRSQPYVAIPVRASLSEWGKATALVAEVLAWIAERDLGLAGPPFFRYWTLGDHVTPFRLAVGAPVQRPVPCEGRIVSGEIPAGRYATAIHRGHPDRLISTIRELDEWLERERLRPRLGSVEGETTWIGRFEFYRTDPKEEPDLENWEIEVAYLLDETAPKG